MTAASRTARTVWSLAAAFHLALVVATLPRWVPGLGEPTWHHNASLGAALFVSAIWWRPMTRDRRFLGIGVLVTTVLAVVSGILILYAKPWLKATDHTDWAKFWHVLWSWFGIAFFLGHTWVNRSGLARSLRRIGSGLSGALWYVLPLVLVLAAIPLTWSDWGADNLQEPDYIPLTLYTWFVLLAPSYAFWAVSAWRSRHGVRSSWNSRATLQGFVDSWLVPMTILANVSGFPLLYLGTKETVLKYVAKYWHTWPSIAMAILVFAHTVQFLPAVARHLRPPTRGAQPTTSSGAPRSV
jgi:hypothetical protein